MRTGQVWRILFTNVSVDQSTELMQGHTFSGRGRVSLAFCIDLMLTISASDNEVLASQSSRVICGFGRGDGTVTGVPVRLGGTLSEVIAASYQKRRFNVCWSTLS